MATSPKSHLEVILEGDEASLLDPTSQYDQMRE